MNVSLLILVGWLSATLAPLPANKHPSPEGEQPAIEQTVPQKAHGKLPKVTRPAKASMKPGSYAFESLQLPPVVSMDQFDTWQPGPAWPHVEDGVVVVTDNAADPKRFMAFLVDVNKQRIAAIRDGDKVRHFVMIGQMTTIGKPGADPHGSTPPTIMTLAGSGAVIIIRPPQPPGPLGIPDDFTAAAIDVATITWQAMNMVTIVKPDRGGLD